MVDYLSSRLELLFHGSLSSQHGFSIHAFFYRDWFQRQKLFLTMNNLDLNAAETGKVQHFTDLFL